jgi:hypothetical protein
MPETLLSKDGSVRPSNWGPTHIDCVRLVVDTADQKAG